MDAEIQAVVSFMKDRIKLSPYDSSKELTLILEGASEVGTGYILVQRVKEDDPSCGFLIINTRSSLIPETKQT